MRVREREREGDTHTHTHTHTHTYCRTWIDLLALCGLITIIVKTAVVGCSGDAAHLLLSLRAAALQARSAFLAASRRRDDYNERAQATERNSTILAIMLIARLARLVPGSMVRRPCGCDTAPTEVALVALRA